MAQHPYPAPWAADSPLSGLYAGISASGRASPAPRGGVGDAFLLRPETDTRMAVALVFRPSPQTARRILQAAAPLGALEPGLYLYPPEDLHVTVMDLQRGEPGLPCPAPALTARYAAAVETALAGLGPFPVAFCGLLASESAVLAAGWPGPELQTLRERLRRVLPQNGLPLAERYETTSCHMTAARLARPAARRQDFCALLDEQARTSFGGFAVDRLELVYHNWYDSRKKTLAAFPLHAAR